MNFNEQKSIDGVKGLLCPHCGSQISGSGSVCPHCGNPPSLPPVLCPYCGTPNPPISSECNRCHVKYTVQLYAQPIGQPPKRIPYTKKVSALSPRKRAFLIATLVVLILLMVVSLASPIFFFMREEEKESPMLQDESLYLYEGQQSTLKYTRPATVDERGIFFSSSDPDVASVDSNGVITAIAEGSCTITIHANNKMDSLSLKVMYCAFKPQELYSNYCTSVWASLSEDKTSLEIDTNPTDRQSFYYVGAEQAIDMILHDLNLQEMLTINDMKLTGQGKEMFEESDVIVVWEYSENTGLKVTFFMLTE